RCRFSWRAGPRDLGQRRKAGYTQALFNLPARPETPVAELTKYGYGCAQYSAGERRHGQHDHRAWWTSSVGRGCRTDQTSLRNRERLLLNGLHVMLKERVVDIARCLRITLQLSKL